MNAYSTARRTMLPEQQIVHQQAIKQKMNSGIAMPNTPSRIQRDSFNQPAMSGSTGMVKPLGG